MRTLKLAGPLGLASILSACATVAPAPVQVSAPAPAPAEVQAAFVPSQPTLKRKIAIGRFSNSTRYGKALLLPGEVDPLADQASDMLMARLVDAGKFLVFERSDLGSVQEEQRISSLTDAQLVGVDALIIGSVTEFGRKTEGQAGFLSSTKKQTAQATVEVRLVDVRTGLAFYSTRGSGSASVEAGEVGGFGSRADYDATLNDRAISAAVSDLLNNVVQTLEERPWFSDVLQVRGDQVMISGGPTQGLKVGDRLRVERQGETLKSGQTGMGITLPSEPLATVQIVSFFGSGDAAGAVTRIVSGRVPEASTQRLIVVEDRS
jgi:curli biogenesis system outer membrane secretion channel CsgG